MKTIFLLHLLYLYSFALHSYTNTDTNYEQNNLSLLEKSLHKGANLREYVSNKFISFSTNIDNYLTNSKTVEQNKNESTIHIQYAYENIQDKNSSNKLDFKVRIKLPKLKDKFRIEFENIDKTNDNLHDARIKEVEKKEKIGLGIGYLSKLKNNLNFSAGAGVRVKLSEFNPYLKAKVLKKIDIYDEWKSELGQKFYLLKKEGFESTSSIEFYKIYTESLKLSNYNELFWREKDRNELFYNSFRVYQNLSKKDYLSYVTSASTNNADSNMQVKNYQAYVSYRHYIKKWLYYDVIPKVLWERENNFDIKYAIRFNFGMFIGYLKN